MIPKIDLNTLMLFQEVVSAGSITRASVTTGISKSTISRKLDQLERDVGSLLLKKNTRTLAVTGIGNKMFEYSRRIAAEVANAGEEVSELQTTLAGPLRVSIPTDFGVSWLGRALAEFSVQHPAIRLQISLNSGPVDLLKEPYDIALQYGRPPPSMFICRRLAALGRGVYASPDYLAEHGTPTTVQDLRHHRCVITEQQQLEAMWTFRNASRKRRLELSGHAVVNSIGLVRELVAGGAGVGVLTHALCRRDVKTKRLVRILSSWESPPLQTFALTLSRERITRKTRTFMDFVALRLAAYEAGNDEADNELHSDV